MKALRAREHAQVPPRLGMRIVAVFIVIQLLLLAALLLIYPAPAAAAALKGEVAVSTKEGYARLVFTLARRDRGGHQAQQRHPDHRCSKQSGRPLGRPHSRSGRRTHVGAARVDPDGSAVRLALNRKVTVNSMAAGEKLFVDLLPEGWTGLPPGLPQDVVEDLARRAREAEKKARRELVVAQQRALPPVRVRVGVQPTFTRYTFALPGLIAVSTNRVDDRMTFTFEAPLKFDLADAQATLPPTVAAIDAQAKGDTISVRFDFIGKADVRTFREDNNYFVDVVPIAPGEATAEPAQQPARTAERAPAPPAKVPEAASQQKPAAAPAGASAAKPPAQRLPLPEPSDPPATIPA